METRGSIGEIWLPSMPGPEQLRMGPEVSAYVSDASVFFSSVALKPLAQMAVPEYPDH